MDRQNNYRFQFMHDHSHINHYDCRSGQSKFQTCKTPFSRRNIPFKLNVHLCCAIAAKSLSHVAMGCSWRYASHWPASVGDL